MSVRGGRSPRDWQKPKRPEMPTWRASDGRGKPPVVERRRHPAQRGPGVPGFVRFLLFAGLLSGVVLIALLTALRPILRAGLVGWAWDNPSSITRFAFVADLVREDLGAAITAPAGGDPTETVFDVNPGDSIFDLAPRRGPRGRGRRRRRSGRSEERRVGKECRSRWSPYH